jgi:hypothetical protein
MVKALKAENFFGEKHKILKCIFMSTSGATWRNIYGQFTWLGEEKRVSHVSRLRHGFYRSNPTFSPIHY